MSDPLPKYWQSLAERASDPGFLTQAQDEFAEPLPVGVAATPPDANSRRDFFKLMGLSAAAAMVACQRAPVQKIIPYVARPDEVTPGLALWYASTCNGCSARCGLLLKTRDGRPIKVEGNDEHPVSRGGVCAVGQASVLSLYDASRARFPTRDAKRVAWAELDADVTQALREASDAGQGIRVVLPWHLGPTAEAAVKRFLAAYPTARTVRDEPLGELAAIAEAHRVTHGVHAVPDYRFDKATVIASFGADFLGTWVSPVAFTRQYTEARDAAGQRKMARHYQVEPMMTLTGAAADRRFVVAPSELRLVLADLVRRLAVKAGRELPGLPSAPPLTLEESAKEELAEALWAQRQGALVVAGGDDVATQVLVNAANALLGSEGRTVSLADGTALDADALSLEALLTELRAATVGAVLFLGANPVYTDPRGEELAALLKQVPLTLSTSDRRDETVVHVGLHAPEPTALESWGDAEVRRGVVSLRQPAVAPLHETRSAVESLLQWAGAPQPHYDFLRARWEAEVFPQAGGVSFSAFWDDALRRGVVLLPVPLAEAPAFREEGLAKAWKGAARPPGEWELVLYPTVAVRDGAPANNGWLQEVADPITKATWGNPACIAPARAKALGLKDGDVVKVRAGDRTVSVPVLVQAGTHPAVIAVPVGYGRTHAGRVANGIGVNAYPLTAVREGRARHAVPGVTVEATGARQPLALTQTHHRLEGRPHVREAELAAFLANPRAGNEVQAGHGGGGHSLSMWSGHEYNGHRWALAVDLSACTGCSACVVSCQAENNIPSVGRDEVLRRREMHWMRIDRYYQGDEANPQVVHQPMMCQHCENAPCETVCPVLATVHSSEGLNQQVYNRCVGTRYCANNCPTKVRRFNWFDYPHDEPLERMVLNPDVVVRSRGVMEKCSLCVQRIQETKAAANREGRPLRDGEIQTACQQSCPAKAIHFGDVNDPDSQVARLAKDGRAFRLLEELNIGSSITYLTKIRNTGSGSGA
ncbi:TAT-variant-translocated molybdopterin oxidoreductase [Comamonas sp. JC664]|uniref:TAT-variant-translocated molybdopterin oxidoreductase n=1 Tax=Comamonas sp. JC664 TaxID=2801917 RepID=UPI001747E3F2|nr:TAT-variant-translocated molybdopterin oxidoreductase [Comamonas sp. JC664]MBL0695744.1 TAT-variant-translocated molybdopterin oxidoreductase [Comamonas sp. JC664]GHG63252.1 Fe-S-cluster-containing hydrogenase [Comamonas sp. KCTC 72670]